MRVASRPPASLATPVRCSTVTPGKFATFCRRPVSRLKRVDLPEFGGPTMAITLGLPDCFGRGSVSAEAALQPSHPLMVYRPCFREALRSLNRRAVRSEERRVG